MRKFLQKILNSKKFLQRVVVFLLVSVGVLLCVLFSARKVEHANKIIHDNKEYAFTSPILDCEYVEQGGESLVNRKDISDKINSFKEEYDIKHVSVYFRDLNNGPWFGVNEKEEFIPASLLKVPLVIGLYRFSEDKKDILSKQINITKEDINIAFPPQTITVSNQLKEGDIVTLGEVARRVVQYSDNIGVPILLKNMPISYVDDIYTSVGGFTLDENIRVKDYASFFRLLYNASYLDRSSSEEVLSLLSNTEYDGGIVAGVPENMVVAHKFGEYAPTDFGGTGLDIDEDEVQLHDCGIVYYPGKPYILCVMTRGKNFKNQENVIKEISRFFYESIKESED
jgi:beta-lactamase class A